MQVACDKCGKELVQDAAYCENCGERTRRARRLVRVALRVEVLFFLAVVGVLLGFIWMHAQNLSRQIHSPGHFP